uniref:Superoxide dismutase n=1 Tax=Liposcelis bostrychophila TaxID=185214 RepID=A0A481SXW2_LIPBO|nr:manganese-iron superoxide dismutase [Liposcelis bostrychophila]
MIAFRKNLFSTLKSGQNVISRFECTLPKLPYEYHALEPVISKEIMEIHHTKHHAAYVNNLNATQEKLKKALEQGDVATAISLGPAIRFNGGGHLNHSIFWHNLSPSQSEPSKELACAINKDFGSLDKLREVLSAAAVGVQGSGWAWLGLHPISKTLQVATCANQDPLQPTTGLVPLLGIDVWEHAYYLQYKNVRPDYVKKIWEIINWKDVSVRFATACK